MFKENIEVIKNTFQQYIGSGMYVSIFFVALIYILLKEKDKKMRCFFAYYPILTLLITLNPLFNKIINPIFTSSVYWRVYWVIPLGITIAYASVKLINANKDKLEKIILIASICVIIILGGELIYTPQNFIKVNNWYKLPDEHVEVAQIIGADEEEYKKLIISEYHVPHIRQVDATIELAFRRDPDGYKDNPLVQQLAGGNVEWVTDYAKKNNCNYIVWKKEVILSDKMENYGFKKLDETENLVIYKLDDKK